MDFEEKELKVFYDAGRLIRPLINVKNNIPLITPKIIEEIKSLLSTDSIKGWNILLNKYPHIINYEDIENTRYIMSAEDTNYLKESIDNKKNTEDNNMINRYGANRFINYTHL